jgi:UDP-N-acetylmuramate--alanine ligase
MRMPSNAGPFHIIGIGGIGMSAIAEILMELGYSVQGSDGKESANVKRLRGKGLRVFIGHAGVNLIGAQYVVISSAIKPDNPELVEARRRRIPVLKRADMLAELMRIRNTVSVTGTHGKTTTTSLIAHVFEQCGADPTVITGGIINSWGSNARLGKGEWMIVEADESDATFIRIPTQMGVITNIDPEHLDYFGTIENMEAAYRTFYTSIPFYGVAVTCVDHPVVRRMLGEAANDISCKVLTYGMDDHAGFKTDIKIVNVRPEGAGSRFDIEIGPRMKGGARTIRDLHMPVPGDHNVLNAAAAFAIASEAAIPDADILPALSSFSGVKRRFTATGTANGVAFYDDYAHHPVEVTAVLKAARATTQGKVIGIFQPHRYSRVQSLFVDFCKAFKDADVVIVTPIYSAGEKAIDGIDHHAVAEGIRKAGHNNVHVVDKEDDMVPLVRDMAQAGDLVIGLGAGTITDWSYALPDLLSGTPIFKVAAGGAH